MRSRSSAERVARSCLRQATEAVHERLHQAPPFVALAEERLSLREYTELLQKIAAFHFTVAAHVDVANERRELISRDLDDLGAAAAPPIRWRAPATAAAKLGCAYVVEGSALGGKVVYRQLDYLFGDSAAGRRFFGGSASDSGRWRALCERLECEGRCPAARDEIIAGAKRAFALFERLISPVPAYA